MKRRVYSVVLNYKNYEETRRCVEGLLRQNYNDHNVVIVDNASPNESFMTLQRVFQDEPRVAVIQTGSNGGYARGNNYAVRWLLSTGSCEYVLIINPDIEFLDDSALSELVHFADDHPEAAVVSPKVVLPSGFVQGPYERPNLSRACIDHIFPFFWYLRRKRHQREIARVRTPVKCYRTIGCCMLVRVSDLVNVGMFDEGTFLECEEQILAELFENSGKYFYHFPQVTVLHHHSRHGNISQSIDSAKYYFERFRGSNRFSLFLFDVSARFYTAIYAPLTHLMKLDA